MLLRATMPVPLTNRSLVCIPRPSLPPLLQAQISPLCPEAHNVLAVLSGSYEAALEHYQRGEEVGLQVRAPERCRCELSCAAARLLPRLLLVQRSVLLASAHRDSAAVPYCILCLRLSPCRLAPATGTMLI